MRGTAPPQGEKKRSGLNGRARPLTKGLDHADPGTPERRGARAPSRPRQKAGERRPPGTATRPCGAVPPATPQAPRCHPGGTRPHSSRLVKVRPTRVPWPTVCNIDSPWHVGRLRLRCPIAGATRDGAFNDSRRHRGCRAFATAAAAPLPAPADCQSRARRAGAQDGRLAGRCIGHSLRRGAARSRCRSAHSATNCSACTLARA